MKAKNAIQYLDAWHRHVRELANVSLDAKQNSTDWQLMVERLHALIHSAACNNFPDEVRRCGRCQQFLVANQGGCRGAQHGNIGCAMNTPEVSHGD